MKTRDTGPKKPAAAALPVPGGRGKKPTPAIGARSSKVKMPRIR